MTVNAQIYVKDDNGNLCDVQPITAINNVSGLQSALNGKVDAETGSGIMLLEIKINLNQLSHSNYVPDIYVGNIYFYTSKVMFQLSKILKERKNNEKYRRRSA